ncbi:MAG: fasciclin domain-containing protein [Ferruginibacter sp.]
MKFHNNYIKNGILAASSALLVLSACNHAPEEFDPIPTPTTSSLMAIGDTLKLSANDSLFYKIIVRGSMLSTINDKTKTFTLFSPGNAAVRQFISGASGGLIPASGAPEATYVGFINSSLPVATAASVVQYHMLPQTVASASISTTFPNFPYPTFLNPSPASSPFLRLDGYISKRTNGAWLNNIPVVAADRMAGNGVIHSIAAVSVPPSTLIWDRINTDTDLTFMKAAIQRADSGAAANASLQYLLGTQAIAPGLNLTLFAPNDAAMRALLIGAITQALVAQGMPLATAQASATALVTAYGTTILTNPSSIPVYGPSLAAALTATTVKGIVVYHILYGQRVFTPNIPTTATAVKTFLNTAIPAHPGVTITATFTGPVVSAATVKGAANATASNVQINALPSGSSDQHYVNGVLHKIDQVLLPQ